MNQSAVVIVSAVVLAGAPLHGQPAGGSATTAAPEGRAIVVTRAEAQASRPGPAENFTGSVRVDQSFEASAPGRGSGPHRTRSSPSASPATSKTSDLRPSQ